MTKNSRKVISLQLFLNFLLVELDPGVADDAADRLGPLQLLQKLLQTSSCRGDRGPLPLPPHPELGSNTMLTYISPNTGSQELSAGICNVFR